MLPSRLSGRSDHCATDDLLLPSSSPLLPAVGVVDIYRCVRASLNHEWAPFFRW
jgi:hypothetical protein